MALGAKMLVHVDSVAWHRRSWGEPPTGSLLHLSEVAYPNQVLREQVTQPSATELRDFLERHIRSGSCLVQVFAQAEVAYQGRAASTAEVGTYLMMLKQDGSLQIHHPKGVKPMNWQPRTDEIRVSVEGETCVLLASRRSPVELVQVIFLEVELAQAIEVKEVPGFYLKGSEAQMQEALARNPDLIESGLTLLDRELLVESGGIDLYARDQAGRFVVVELKRGKATQNAVSQLARYVRSVEGVVGEGSVRGILAAPEITKPALLELRGRGLEFRVVSALPLMAETASAAVSQPGLFD